MANKSRYWFKRRRYGWGWTPVTREGWASILIFMTVIIAAALFLLPPKGEDTSFLRLITFGLIFLSALFFMIGISYAKGPLPKWRWGVSDNDSSAEDI